MILVNAMSPGSRLAQEIGQKGKFYDSDSSIEPTAHTEVNDDDSDSDGKKRPSGTRNTNWSSENIQSDVDGNKSHTNTGTPNADRGERLGVDEPPTRPTRKNRQRKRLSLPLLLHTKGGPFRVTGCPDTGSEDNIVSLELVKRLDLPVKPVDKDTRMFSLANGNRISAVGQTSFSYTFGGDEESNILSECMAYVFETLVVPLITGAEFLTETKIFTEHRELLVEEIIPMMQSLRVNSVGKPKQSLVCRLDTFVGCANADTGSDLDLISPDFAKSRAMKIEPATEKLQFADGSISYTSGIVETSFSVGVVDTVRGFVQSGQTLNLDFFVLESLSSDILVGQDTLEELSVFIKHTQCLLSVAPSLGRSDCNIIRHIGSIETKLSKMADLATKVVDKVLRRPATTEEPKSQPYPRLGSIVRTARQNLIDIQRENARLEELSSPESSTMTSFGPGLSSSDTLYHGSSEESGVSSHSSPNFILVPSTYACTFPGCAAPPFQTQYLLNCHLNVHSSARPYYCPVSGCPRAEGGKGFKRETEMIRHGLVHDSPGYFCPFCPDCEHKYPRPDNLQRHVRVHHIDIDKDDPRLRAVLSQRPDGPSRGRRRRGGP
ncbi:hypothetical protein V8F33_001971 [Rhypophila sp. PSN 637]